MSLLFFNGAMGTELMRRCPAYPNSTLRCNQLFPQVVTQIHKDYALTGCQYFSTNTFEALYRAANGDLTTATLCQQAVDHLCQAVDKSPKYFSIGPVGSNLCSSKELVRFLRPLIKLGNACDGWIVETQTDLAQAATTIDVINEGSSLPIILSFSPNQYADNSESQDFAEKILSMFHNKVQVLGFNCGYGPWSLLNPLKALRRITDRPLYVAPNLSPTEKKEDQLQDLLNASQAYAQLSVSFIGGCCHTTPSMMNRLMQNSLTTKKDS